MSMPNPLAKVPLLKNLLSQMRQCSATAYLMGIAAWRVVRQGSSG